MTVCCEAQVRDEKKAKKKVLRKIMWNTISGESGQLGKTTLNRKVELGDKHRSICTVEIQMTERA
jgi:hypothetical protein